MRLKPITWLLISLCLFIAAGLFWHWGEQQKAAYRAANGTNATAVKPVSTQAPSNTGTNVSAAKQSVPSEANGYRLSNTAQPIGELERNDHAILLRNATIDTTKPLDFQIPDALKSKEAPSSYVVQSRQALDQAFYGLLSHSGAEFVSYIPNNAALVNASDAIAAQLRGNAMIQSVVPYEPYYKLDLGLLAAMAENKPLGTNILVSGSRNNREAMLKTFTDLGLTVLTEDRGPFGLNFIVREGEAATGPIRKTTLESLALAPVVQELEPSYPRTVLNDLTRPIMGEANNTVLADNYLGLTGSNIWINIDDSGVEATHPDLTGRVFGANNAPGWLLWDTNYNSMSMGHGTHVAGIIAGDGTKSDTVTGAAGSINPGVLGQYRGKAPKAKLFAQPLNATAPFDSDAYLQEAAARTNSLVSSNKTLISNDSWGYVGLRGYGMPAASFDAATRDAIPGMPGSQSVLYVFSAGNSGNGANSGLGGQADSILAPASGKNVIAVGALECNRNITNEVVRPEGTNNITNSVFAGFTQSSTLVAPYSSRGNVGIGLEGQFGRFKPDVVAPGTFVISTRSSTYSDPTNGYTQDVNYRDNQTVALKSTNFYQVFVPLDGIQLAIFVLPNSSSTKPFPNFGIVADQVWTPSTLRGTNGVQFDVTSGTWNFGVCSPGGNHPASYDVVSIILRTNETGNYYQVLSALNTNLGPNYRYETGTSMAAPAVSGMLGLMQEFLVGKGVQPSPALLKAMLINGALPSDAIYDFQVKRNSANQEGWGLPNIRRSLPTDMVTTGSGPVQFFDQNPTNALATGQSHTRMVHIGDGAHSSPLRITLVWTDPPGNPAASIKLVNDLDLIVTNLDTHEVYVGNNFLGGEVYSTKSTNVAPSDVINNVENVFMNAFRQPLSTNYSVTVRAARVNVNAVTAHTNGIVQDYALVISSLSSTSATPFTVDLNMTSTTNSQALVDVLTNGFPALYQRVGANSPYLLSTNGSLSQWHFYVFTNTVILTNGNATNAVFVTFLPPNLSIPRNTDADIDLYVSKSSGLTNLDPAVIDSPLTHRSLRRGGSEFVYFNDSKKGDIFYVGIKSEDQQAAEYGLVGVATDQPLGSRNPDGSLDVKGLALPVNIPDAVFAVPGKVIVVGAVVDDGKPMDIRKVTVTNGITHQLMGDLTVELKHAQTNVRLKNQSSYGTASYQETVYDDSKDGTHPSAVRSDGPGSLRDFNGQSALGEWVLTVNDNLMVHTGSVQLLDIHIDPKKDQENGFDATIQPNTWYYDFVNIPTDGTNLSIMVSSGGSGSAGIYLYQPDYPTFDLNYAFTNITFPGGGALNWSITNTPPLSDGWWYYGIYNPGPAAINVHVVIRIDRRQVPDLVVDYTSTNTWQTLTNDMVTTNSIYIPWNERVFSTQVGIRIADPRAADLALSLTSPQGTRVLLFENRGRTNTEGLGLTVTNASGVTNFVYAVFTEDTNYTTTPIKFALPPYGSTNGIVIDSIPLVASDFDATGTAGDYTNGQGFDGWTVVSSNAWSGNTLYTNTMVSVVADPTLANSGNNFLALGAGHLMRTNETIPGHPYRLTYAFRGPGIVDWWSGNNNTKDLIGTNTGTFIGSNSYAFGKVDWSFELDGTNYIKVPASPSLDVGQARGLTFECWIDPTDVSLWHPLAEWNNGIYSDWIESIGTYFWIYSQPSQLFVNLIDENAVEHGMYSPVNILATNQFQHVAVTYDKASGIATIYCNGIVTVARNLGVFNPQTSWDLYLGARPAGVDRDKRYKGLMDEVGLYSRALSHAEIRGIYNAGSVGKYSANSPMPSAQVVVDGMPGVVVGNSTNWQTNTLVFTATTNSTVIELDGNPLGMLFDSFKLEEVPNTNYANYYLPEESLNIFKGELAKGNWTLQAWDTRTGQQTNANLISWDLKFTFSSTNVNLIVLTNRVLFTNTIAAGSNVFFGFDVPADANFTTNSLTNLTGTAGLDLLFNQTQLPTGTLLGDVALMSGVRTSDARVLGRTTSFPLIQPGKRYFLGLYNSSATPQDYSIQIDTDVDPNFTAIPLTNTVSFYVPATNVTQYFYYDVSQLAKTVVFEVLQPTNDVDLYVQRGLPAPGPKNFDYFSAYGGTNDEAIWVSTNSLPVPLTAQRWYLAVTTAGQATYSVKVTEFTNLVELTNSVPYTNTVPGAGAPVQAATFVSPMRAMASGATAANSIQYISVPVPEQATFATHTLTNITVNGTGLSLLFNQSGLPTGTGSGDYTLLTNVISGTNTILLNGVPPLQPRTTYTLGVLNTNSVPQTYVLEVTFGLGVNIVNLTNTLAYSNSIPVTNALQYYSFDVPPNTGWVAYEILNPKGDVNLAVRHTLPLPDFQNYDYVSTNRFTNNEAIVVVTNVTVGRWYLVVTNTSGVSNSYSIRATAWSITNGLTVLTNHIAYTNTVATNAIKYFAVDVPSNVISVNNTLFSTNGLNTNGLTLLFNQTNMPLGTLPWDYTLLTNVTTSSSILLSTNIPVTNSVPPLPVLQPGQRYYLGVVNTNSTNAQFVVQVDFAYGSIPLTNAISYTNTIGTDLAPQYYSFTVSSNAQRVTFEVLNPSGDVDLVAKLGLFPDLVNRDYISTNSGITNEFILVLTNSTPVALTNGTWYLGVYNTTGAGNVNYSIRASEWDSSTNLVVITNAVGYTNLIASNSYSYFAVDVPVDAIAAVNSLASSNTVDLLYSSVGLPTGFLPGDYLLLTNVLTTNAVADVAVIKTNGTVPLLEPGQRYFLGVHNTNAQPAQFTLNVEFVYLVTPLTNGILFTNRIASTNTVQFYSFDVVTNKDTLLFFEIIKATDRLKFTAHRTLPNSDYGSTNLGANYQSIVITNLNDLVPGSWLLSVHSLAGTNALTYGIRATEMQSPVIVSLTNGVAYSDRVEKNGRRFYSFDVTNNATMVTFDVLHPGDYVDMVVRHSMPLPDYLNADYTVLNQYPNDQELLVTPSSTPVPLSAGRWYIGLYSPPGGFAADYEFRATQYTNPVSLVTLTNRVSYKNAIAGPGFAFGTNQQFVFYRFVIKNSAPAVVFTAANMANTVNLVARKGAYPTISTYDFGSFNLGLQQVLLIQTNETLTSLNGTWYLAVPNPTGADVRFDIAGTTLTTNGLSAQPIMQSLSITNGFQFSWSSIPGLQYEIDVSTNLPVFTPLTNFTAGSATSIFIGSSPTNGIPYQFYRIIELLP